MGMGLVCWKDEELRDSRARGQGGNRDWRVGREMKWFKGFCWRSFGVLIGEKAVGGRVANDGVRRRTRR